MGPVDRLPGFSDNMLRGTSHWSIPRRFQPCRTDRIHWAENDRLDLFLYIVQTRQAYEWDVYRPKETSSLLAPPGQTTPTQLHLEAAHRATLRSNVALRGSSHT